LPQFLAVTGPLMADIQAGIDPDMTPIERADHFRSHFPY
jgi:hypothetical protein